MPSSNLHNWLSLRSQGFNPTRLLSLQIIEAATCTTDSLWEVSGRRFEGTFENSQRSRLSKLPCSQTSNLRVHLKTHSREKPKNVTNVIMRDKSKQQPVQLTLSDSTGFWPDPIVQPSNWSSQRRQGWPSNWNLKTRKVTKHHTTNFRKKNWDMI